MAKTRFEIELWPLARANLDALRAFDARRVQAAIAGQLRYAPQTESRNRKRLFGVTADFEFDPPLWELKVGEYRVFYDVNAAGWIVNVRAVRRKPRGITTAEVLG